MLWGLVVGALVLGPGVRAGYDKRGSCTKFDPDMLENWCKGAGATSDGLTKFNVNDPYSKHRPYGCYKDYNGNTVWNSRETNKLGWPGWKHRTWETVCPTSCLSGTYLKTGATQKCTQCPAGKYQSTRTLKSSCDDCRAGRYGDSTGRTTECSDFCAAGYNCPEGSTTDQGVGQCAAGTSSLAGQCVDCTAGKYQSLAGKSKCVDCTAGKYQSLAGQSTCVDCTAGKYQSLLRQSTCVDCTAGKYQSLEGQPTCVDCPYGDQTTDSASTDVSACVVTPARAFPHEYPTHLDKYLDYWKAIDFIKDDYGTLCPRLCNALSTRKGSVGIRDTTALLLDSAEGNREARFRMNCYMGCEYMRTGNAVWQPISQPTDAHTCVRDAILPDSPAPSCQADNTPRILMYKGNKKDAADAASRCSLACQYQPAGATSWFSANKVQGFHVNIDTGECVCSSEVSCTLTSLTRYDFGTVSGLCAALETTASTISPDGRDLKGCVDACVDYKSTLPGLPGVVGDDPDPADACQAGCVYGALDQDEGDYHSITESNDVSFGQITFCSGTGLLSTGTVCDLGLPQSTHNSDRMTKRLFNNPGDLVVMVQQGAQDKHLVQRFLDGGGNVAIYSCPRGSSCPRQFVRYDDDDLNTLTALSNPIVCPVTAYAASGGSPECEPCYSFRQSSVKTGGTRCWCEDGYFENSGGSCTICPAGQFCRNNTKTACPDAKYAQAPGQTACAVCTEAPHRDEYKKPLTYRFERSGAIRSTSGATHCLCKDGYYKGAPLNSNANECTICPRGSSCSDRLTQIKCGADSEYQPQEGQEFCQICPTNGNYTAIVYWQGRQISVASCTCKPGFYVKYGEPDSANKYGCENCPPGSFCPGGDPMTSSTTQLLCRGPTAYSTGNAAACSECDAGLTSNGTACRKLCDPGWYVDDTSNKCQPCTRGARCPNAESHQCDADGEWQNATAQTTCRSSCVDQTTPTYVSQYVSDDRSACLRRVVCPYKSSRSAFDADCVAECPRDRKLTTRLRQEPAASTVNLVPTENTGLLFKLNPIDLIPMKGLRQRIQATEFPGPRTTGFVFFSKNQKVDPQETDYLELSQCFSASTSTVRNFMRLEVLAEKEHVVLDLSEDALDAGDEQHCVKVDSASDNGGLQSAETWMHALLCSNQQDVAAELSGGGFRLLDGFACAGVNDTLEISASSSDKDCAWRCSQRASQRAACGYFGVDGAQQCTLYAASCKPTAGVGGSLYEATDPKRHDTFANLASWALTTCQVPIQFQRAWSLAKRGGDKNPVLDWNLLTTSPDSLKTVLPNDFLQLRPFEKELGIAPQECEAFHVRLVVSQARNTTSNVASQGVAMSVDASTDIAASSTVVSVLDEISSTVTLRRPGFTTTITIEALDVKFCFHTPSETAIAAECDAMSSHPERVVGWREAKYGPPFLYWGRPVFAVFRIVDPLILQLLQSFDFFVREVQACVPECATLADVDVLVDNDANAFRIQGMLPATGTALRLKFVIDTDSSTRNDWNSQAGSLQSLDSAESFELSPGAVGKTACVVDFDTATVDGWNSTTQLIAALGPGVSPEQLVGRQRGNRTEFDVRVEGNCDAVDNVDGVAVRVADVADAPRTGAIVGSVVAIGALAAVGGALALQRRRRRRTRSLHRYER